ncbi:MAG: hypothetical protein ABW185_05280 [Sedimenticola sp.]
MATEAGGLGGRPKRASAQNISDYRKFGETGHAQDVSEDVMTYELFSPTRKGQTSASEGAAEGGELKHGTAGMLGKSAPLFAEDSDSDTEFDALKRELVEVEAVKRRLERQKEKQVLREKLERSKKEVKKLEKEGKRVVTHKHVKHDKHIGQGSESESVIKGAASCLIDGSITKPKVGSSGLSINDLRKDAKLNKKVNKYLKNTGLVESQTDSGDSSSESDDESEAYGKTSSSSSENTSHIKSKKSKSKLKSGISAKASDKVRFPQQWPQSNLQYEYVNKAVKFDELDFKLFVAGELEIISADNISKLERTGRLALLKKIVYYSGVYSFEGLRGFYAAWLRQVELGLRKWSDDSQMVEQALLSKHLLRDNFQNRKQSQGYVKFSNQSKAPRDLDSEKVWFCALFNRNKCTKQQDHMEVIRGRMRHCLHICAECWQKDGKKLKHPESAKECPHSVG